MFCFLKFGFMSSLYYFLYIKVFKYHKNWVEDKIIFSVKKKKKRRPEFWRYEKSTQYKFFLIILPKLSTKCKELIFDLTPSFFFLASILCVIFGHFYSKWIFWSITCEPYLWKSKFRKLRPWWQAEKYFWEVFILVSLSLSSFGNSVYPRKVYSQVPA